MSVLQSVFLLFSLFDNDVCVYVLFVFPLICCCLSWRGLCFFSLWKSFLWSSLSLMESLWDSKFDSNLKRTKKKKKKTNNSFMSFFPPFLWFNPAAHAQEMKENKQYNKTQQNRIEQSTQIDRITKRSSTHKPCIYEKNAIRTFVFCFVCFFGLFLLRWITDHSTGIGGRDHWERSRFPGHVPSSIRSRRTSNVLKADLAEGLSAASVARQARATLRAAGSRMMLRSSKVRPSYVSRAFNKQK